MIIEEKNVQRVKRAFDRFNNWIPLLQDRAAYELNGI